MVAGAQRVISAMSAVMAVAIEAGGRREGEALGVDRAAWEVMADAGTHQPGEFDQGASSPVGRGAYG